MAPTRKTRRRTAPSTTLAKRKRAKPHSIKATLPPGMPAPSRTLPVASPGFLIVGIGASAGGLEAMEEFFCHMPTSSGMAFVVVSHQRAGHVSLLPSLLSKCTAMPVVEITDGMEVEANRVYMAPGGISLAMLHGLYRGQDVSPNRTEGICAQWPPPSAGGGASQAHSVGYGRGEGAARGRWDSG